MFRLLARRWVFFVIVLPLAAWLLEQVRTQLEHRQGESGLTRGIGLTSQRLRQFSGGRGRRGF